LDHLVEFNMRPGQLPPIRLELWSVNGHASPCQIILV
jgi:hypothetical protein